MYVAQLHFTQTLTAKIAGELGVMPSTATSSFKDSSKIVAVWMLMIKIAFITTTKERLMSIKISALTAALISTIALAAGSSFAFAGDSECVTKKLQAIKGEEWKYSPEYGVMCHPMHIDGFRGCVGRDNENTNFPFSAPEGWAFKPDTARFESTSRNSGSRTGISIIETTNKKITVNLTCNGHGCGGEGRVWNKGKIKVKAERRPSSDEVQKIMKDCGF